jgi:GNAT superfamily N-acetyltransferase
MTTTPATTVRHAVEADQPDLGRIISRAFHDDPVNRWVLPDEERRAAIGPAVFELYASVFVPLGQTFVTGDLSGAALWAPPGQEPVPEEEAEAFGQRVEAIAGEDAARMFELEALFAEHHPTTPYWHLQLLGTVPERQGQGIGSVLLSAVLGRCDREGAPAYLEATSPENRRLYERHGFVATGTNAPAGGPTLTAMWRDPA